MAGSQQEIIIPADLPLVLELGATLREWAQIWHKLYVVCVDYLSVSGTHSPVHLSDSPSSDSFLFCFIPLKDVLV